MGRSALRLAVGVAVVACGVAVVVAGRRLRRRRKWRRAVEVVKELEESCETGIGRLRQIVDAMAVEMHAGLASEGGSKLKMLLTFVDRLPTGGEIGTYYALDLGSENIGIWRVKLAGRTSSIISKDMELHSIPEHLTTSTCEELFDFIGSKLKEFVEKEENGTEFSALRTRELGFTVSFPVKQTSIRSGTLIKWTKELQIEDMVGREIVECLRAGLTRNGLDMQVAVLANDTLGTLALEHYHDADTVAAVIIGSGTNACYFERSDAIIKCQGLLSASGGMVVNMEWGYFWSSHLPRTSYDIDLDAESPNPNDQGFEKMISGMYLGDIVRRVILRISQESDIFGPVSSRLLAPFVLRTPHVIQMHEDDSPDLEEVERILRETLEVQEVPLKARKLVARICDVVTRRAAQLVAAGIGGILKKIGRDGTGGITKGNKNDVKMKRTVMAIEGMLYSSYMMFREYIHEALNEILGEEVARHVILKASEDGSGVGAAVLAALYSSYSVDSLR